MKHILRDNFIHLCSMFGITFVCRQIQKRNGPLVRVVAFHDVQDAQWFQTVIADIAQRYNVLTPAQFYTNQFDASKINVLLTFDDGYQSWLDVCVPVLSQFRLIGLFFINSGLLDCEQDIEKVALYMKEHLRISPKQALTWKGAQVLLASGHTLGGHSVSHLDLASLTDSMLFEEIVADKKRIEEKLDVRLVDFAYPFGTKRHYTKKVIECVKQAGYLYQYSARSGFVVRNVTPITRTLIERNQPIMQINRWIEGGYDIFSRILCK